MALGGPKIHKLDRVAPPTAAPPGRGGFSAWNILTPLLRRCQRPPADCWQWKMIPISPRTRWVSSAQYRHYTGWQHPGWLGGRPDNMGGNFKRNWQNAGSQCQASKFMGRVKLLRLFYDLCHIFQTNSNFEHFCLNFESRTNCNCTEFIDFAQKVRDANDNK